MKIRFVIRSRNEERWIGHTIQSVVSCFGKDSEIIIVDNQSSDDTLEIVKLFPKRFHNIEVFTIERSKYTPGKSLNLGISKCSGDIICIISSHCVVRDFDLGILKSHFEDPCVFGVMGKQVPFYRGMKKKMRYIWKNFDVQKTVVNPMEDIGFVRPFFHNAFSFIRKSDWEAVNFDEDLAGKEDRYWAEKLISDGKKFILDPRLSVDHHWTPKGATWS